MISALLALILVVLVGSALWAGFRAGEAAIRDRMAAAITALTEGERRTVLHLLEKGADLTREEWDG